MFKYLYSRSTLASDLSAGLTLGIQSVPDGLANGILAGVNPIHGLYAYMVGSFTGAFFTSSVYMTIQATSAMALIVASIPQVRDPQLGAHYLAALGILTGVIMVVLGVLKLGTMLRFVPRSVMVGFISAIAVLIVLGQLSDLVGFAAPGSNSVIRALFILFNRDLIDPRSLTVGVFAIILILVLERTALKSLGMVVALIFASLLSASFGWESVTLARDIAVIPDQLPRPFLPQLVAFPTMIIPALSLALVGLIQGAGISQAYSNPDGRYPDASRDFTGQGIANLASGVLQGNPVAGSLSATALSINSGAQTRLANITAGVTMALAILFFGNLIGFLAMPSVAGLLIVVGFRTLKLDDIRMVYNTGGVQQIVALMTFVTALFTPLQYAVLMGVALAIVLNVFKESEKITIKEVVHKPGQFPLERPVPEFLRSNSVIVLHAYGSLFFATAQRFEDQLPKLTDDTVNALVILRLRGRTDLGATFLGVLRRYSEKLSASNSRLILAGVSDQTLNELEKTGLIMVFGWENVFRAKEHIMESSVEAYAEGARWLAQQQVVLTPSFEDAASNESA